MLITKAIDSTKSFNANIMSSTINLEVNSHLLLLIYKFNGILRVLCMVKGYWLRSITVPAKCACHFQFAFQWVFRKGTFDREARKKNYFRIIPTPASRFISSEYVPKPTNNFCKIKRGLVPGIKKMLFLIIFTAYPMTIFRFDCCLYSLHLFFFFYSILIM